MENSMNIFPCYTCWINQYMEKFPLYIGDIWKIFHVFLLLGNINWIIS